MTLYAATPPRRQELTVWATLAGAPLLWSLDLLTIYALASNACQIGGGLTKALVIGIGTVAAALAVAGAMLSARALRQWSAGPLRPSTPTTRPAFMAQLAAALGTLFTIGIVFETIGAFMLQACP